jgi:hypothetical protein
MNTHKSFGLTIVSLLVIAAFATPARGANDGLLAGPCTAGGVYNPSCDVDHDGDVDIFDIQLTSGHWNQAGLYTSGAWDLTGNAGTNPASNFLGTTDNAALELRVNGFRALRLEPFADRPNVIAGSYANTVTSSVEGATIAGGGSNLTFNRVTDSYGVIGGGSANAAGDNAGTVNDRAFATVGGGGYNTASGWRSTIGGGWGNTANGESATIGGGQTNETSSITVYATIGGGYDNTVSASYGTVGGGDSNQAAGTAAAIGGGQDNWASSYGVVAGGIDNTANPYGTVPGGANNFAAGDYSLAAGRRAKAYFDGNFVWADSSDADFGATAANQFIVRAGGGVGVGTNSPDNQLHVAEAINLSATPGNHVAQIENTSTGSSADVLALKIGYTGNPVDSTNFITFFKGNDTSAGSIEGNGSGGVVLAGPGNEFALWLPRQEPGEDLQPGDVVGLFAGQVSRHTAGADQWLVVSGGAIVAGGDPGSDRRVAYVPVTLLGLANVRVRGPVQAGDLIVPSGAADGAGVAVPVAQATAEQARQAMGQAWQSDATVDERLVPVAVGGWRDDPRLTSLLAQVTALQQQNAALEARLVALEKAAR